MAIDTEAGQAAPLVVVQTARSEEAITVEVAGDIDIATSPRLRAEVFKLLADAPGAAMIDMTGVGFCDSSGLSVLVQLNRHCEEAGIELSFVPSKVLRRALELTGLLPTLKVDTA
ncbi:anti-sigma B factor antagonist [Amycolatopsis lurida]|uniref:Anti-sigma factor antagonist n=1 Tax=Amycolatopsis lurida NRRL 2430 TaxID=1460371 RepID=A0A2P2FGL0_AMYLU|nr:STAS domain-containing protein [Amycolatopsis lurida]KFU75861.1 anti-anti-sigma factor [Amycolatopsis lurida NRRL 2430]SEE33852.1 anti-sigma B factor antagonist [Amycolatopsis lurida]